MRTRYPSLLIVAAALGGCTVGPNFHRPAVPTDNAYLSAQELSSQAAGPVAQPGAGPDGPWWQAFGSAELNSLVDRAMANNHSLAAADATLEQARQRIAAVGGQRLPQIDANTRVEREEVNLAGFGFDASSFGSNGNPIFTL